jgi:hypothetical protein
MFRMLSVLMCFLGSVFDFYDRTSPRHFIRSLSFLWSDHWFCCTENSLVITFFVYSECHVCSEGILHSFPVHWCLVTNCSHFRPEVLAVYVAVFSDRSSQFQRMVGRLGRICSCILIFRWRLCGLAVDHANRKLKFEKAVQINSWSCEQVAEVWTV